MSLGIGLGLNFPIVSGAAPFVGLLDLYPGASVGYSLRKLRNEYSGSAIRVRRSSDDAEQDIGFSSNEIDTVSLLSFVGAGDGCVTTWYDQSGNDAHAVQANSSTQPMIISNGNIIFDGAKSALSFNGGKIMPIDLTGLGVALQDMAAYWLGNYSSITAEAQYGFSLTAGGETRFYVGSLASTPQNQQNFMIGLVDPFANQSPSIFNKRMWSMAHIGTDARAYLNDTLLGNAVRNVSQTYANNHAYIGGVSNVPRTNGTIQEIVIFDNALGVNSTEIDNSISGIFSNLDNYYQDLDA